MSKNCVHAQPSDLFLVGTNNTQLEQIKCFSAFSKREVVNPATLLDLACQFVMITRLRAWGWGRIFTCYAACLLRPLCNLLSTFFVQLAYDLRLATSKNTLPWPWPTKITRFHWKKNRASTVLKFDGRYFKPFILTSNISIIDTLRAVRARPKSITLTGMIASQAQNSCV